MYDDVEIGGCVPGHSTATLHFNVVSMIRANVYYGTIYFPQFCQWVCRATMEPFLEIWKSMSMTVVLSGLEECLHN